MFGKPLRADVGAKSKMHTKIVNLELSLCRPLTSLVFIAGNTVGWIKITAYVIYAEGCMTLS